MSSSARTPRGAGTGYAPRYGTSAGASAEYETNRLEDRESGRETSHEHPRVGPPESELTIEPAFARFHVGRRIFRGE
jgi:hypothetical protein